MSTVEHDICKNCGSFTHSVRTKRGNTFISDLRGQNKDPSLLIEGLANEIMHHIQNTRKEFDLIPRINVDMAIECGPEEIQAIYDHFPRILERCGLNNLWVNIKPPHVMWTKSKSVNIAYEIAGIHIGGEIIIHLCESK